MDYEWFYDIQARFDYRFNYRDQWSFVRDYLNDYSIVYIIDTMNIIAQIENNDSWFTLEELDQVLHTKLQDEFWVNNVTELPNTKLLIHFKDLYKNNIVPKL